MSTELFINTFFICTEDPMIQILDTDELNMALGTRKFSRAIEKRTSGQTFNFWNFGSLPKRCGNSEYS